jgi:hypothetical protein
MTIKKIRTKLKNKNKLNDTFIFWQREEREKREKKKKSLEPNRHSTAVNMHSINEKMMAKCFQRYPIRRHLVVRRYPA